MRSLNKYDPYSLSDGYYNYSDELENNSHIEYMINIKDCMYTVVKITAKTIFYEGEDGKVRKIHKDKVDFVYQYIENNN